MKFAGQVGIDKELNEGFVSTVDNAHCRNVVLVTFENSLAKLYSNYIVNFEHDERI